MSLWAGPDLKLTYAHFHLREMERIFVPRDRDSRYRQTGNGMVAANWQVALYAHCDAFLAAARSIPDVIRCCFGVDPMMNKWIAGLPTMEQQRRHQFDAAFVPHFRSIKQHRLSLARNLSLHRSGVPPVDVRITSLFGMIHVGGPAIPIPETELRTGVPDDLAWMVQPVPIEPRWQDFRIDGRPLFESCQEYLTVVGEVIRQGRAIAAAIHGDQPLTPPPW